MNQKLKTEAGGLRAEKAEKLSLGDWWSRDRQRAERDAR
jgi:hypothetical protein